MSKSSSIHVPRLLKPTPSTRPAASTTKYLSQSDAFTTSQINPIKATSSDCRITTSLIALHTAKCKRCKNNHGRRSSSRSTVGFWAPSDINPALIPPLLGPTFPTRPSTPQRRATPGMAPYVPMYSLYSSGRRIPQHVRSEGDHHRVVFQKEKSPLPNFLASFVPR